MAAIRTSANLAGKLRALDGKSYGAYKSLRGSHELPSVRWAERNVLLRAAKLHIDKVQSDPFAPASLLRVTMDRAELPFRGASRSLDDALSTAELDLLNRNLVRAFAKSRGLRIDSPGQQVLPRAAVTATANRLTICFEAEMPARGRRILGQAAAKMLCEDLPKAIETAIFQANPANLDRAAELEFDQQSLREQVAGAGLVGFIADGAMIARAAGNSDLPKRGGIPAQSPETLRHSFTLPSGSSVEGMGIPHGVTLIVGGGYHGKSTLLDVLVTGVYNHIDGDGREFVVADQSACALRAEDGRAITNVDISPFISNLPTRTDTRRFSTTNASGSTSQAAALMEAVEAGARVLLIDEDTSATNFMIRDERMRRLVPAECEPITPLLDHVRTLWEEFGISTVIVAGGSGAFIDVADTVICMDAYRPLDKTAEARELSVLSHFDCDADSRESGAGVPVSFHTPAERILSAHLGSLQQEQSQNGRGRGNVGKRGGRQAVGKQRRPRAKGRETIQVGKETIDLRGVSHLVDASQTQGIARALDHVLRSADGYRSLADAIDVAVEKLEVSNEITSEITRHPGRIAAPRALEVAAALNRYRKLKID